MAAGKKSIGNISCNQLSTVLSLSIIQLIMLLTRSVGTSSTIIAIIRFCLYSIPRRKEKGRRENYEYAKM
jgi:hypothetical protein